MGRGGSQCTPCIWQLEPSLEPQLSVSAQKELPYEVAAFDKRFTVEMVVFSDGGERVYNAALKRRQGDSEQPSETSEDGCGLVEEIDEGAVAEPQTALWPLPLTTSGRCKQLLRLVHRVRSIHQH